MDFQGRKILIIGAGISGIAAAGLLDGISEVVLYDSGSALDAMEIRAKLPEHFRGRIVLGALPEEVTRDAQIAVLSPGVPTDLPEVNGLRESGVEIIGEVELAYQFSKGRIAAVTGTNGKTTTTALLGEIMRTFCESVFVVGNIGVPYTEMAVQTREDSVTVAELSSFQLETIRDFRPEVSLILNITPDHLNRHHTMENYIAAKLNIAKNQTKDDTCILNYEDDVLREAGRELPCRTVWFSSRRRLSDGMFLDGKNIVHAEAGEETVVCSTDDLNIIGRHNHENAMAAIAAGLALGVPMDCIRRALRSFVAVEHRIEYVATKRGVKYYNDSKGTNPDAAIQAVRAMTTNTLLIGGGYDKGSEYE
ncbi:MAG: UDP-N-acetylmuramoyl-L-alanine--D-glutamate ligase, partial [Lachnospiraceae bacterium]|nr:UDP-N-acetylmuramoyl-L-alanine--D-glutamate ligase [Lachnospiraceae bacterium]